MPATKDMDIEDLKRKKEDKFTNTSCVDVEAIRSDLAEMHTQLLRICKAIKDDLSLPDTLDNDFKKMTNALYECSRSLIDIRSHCINVGNVVVDSRKITSVTLDNGEMINQCEGNVN